MDKHEKQARDILDAAPMTMWSGRAELIKEIAAALAELEGQRDDARAEIAWLRDGEGNARRAALREAPTEPTIYRAGTVPPVLLPGMVLQGPVAEWTVIDHAVIMDDGKNRCPWRASVAASYPLARDFEPPAKASAEPARCEVCDWPIAKDGSGCAPGDCSYRPAMGTAEYRRIAHKHAELEVKARMGNGDDHG